MMELFQKIKQTNGMMLMRKAVHEFTHDVLNIIPDRIVAVVYDVEISGDRCLPVVFSECVCGCGSFYENSQYSIIYPPFNELNDSGKNKHNLHVYSEYKDIVIIRSLSEGRYFLNAVRSGSKKHLEIKSTRKVLAEVGNGICFQNKSLLNKD